MERTPWAAAIGTVVFTILVPGSVIGLGPFLLTRWRLDAPFFGWEASRWVGVVLFLLAAPIFADFLVRFVREGRGTPAPVAPTRHLVVGGPFRHVRNPAYVCVLAMLAGQALLFGSVAVLIYAAIMALGFHLFVVLFEEPTLRATFGAEYEAYCRRVPRWIPTLRPTREDGSR
jgi:protein-S-isoprenylcysteine O-methyltransferase Ste14